MTQLTVTVIKTIADSYTVDKQLVLDAGIDLDDGEAVAAFCEAQDVADYTNPETLGEVEFIVN